LAKLCVQKKKKKHGVITWFNLSSTGSNDRLV
jgi:hypothetical protein